MFGRLTYEKLSEINMKKETKTQNQDRVEIRQIPTGVPGLDEILGGGLPEFSFNIIAGAPGGGKTTAIQKLATELAETARQNRRAPIPLRVELREWTQADQLLPEFIASRLDGLGVYLSALLSEKRAALLLGREWTPRIQLAHC